MQNNVRNRQTQGGPALIEKIIATLSYLTMGFVGFLWLLLGLFTKSNLRPFLKYHIYQSIFLSLAYFLICAFLGLFLGLLSHIPLVGSIIMQITLMLNMPLIFEFSAIQIGMYAIIFYLGFTCLQGQYSYIPWVSDIIKANVR